MSRMVDQGWLARTKAAGDTHPLIKVFRIAHEGDADIRFNGILTPVKWIKSAVGWVKDKLELFTPVFNHHGPPGDNSHTGRTVIGEIVGSDLVEEDNTTATVAAMYIKPEFRGLKLDVASIEAEITYARDGDTVWPTSIIQITGVALADSRYSTPGFPEATILGSIAAFAQEGKNVMNIHEIKSAVSELSLKPEDVFAPETLTGSTAVRDFIVQRNKDAQEHTRRVSDEKEKLRKELEDKYGAELAELRKRNMKFETSANFTLIAGERKLDDKEKAYVELQLPQFRPDTDDPVKFKEALNVFVDERLEDFGSLKPIFGMETAASESADGNTGSGDSASGASGSTQNTDYSEDDMLDPNVNPLIPGGKADLEYGK